jgi:hypothetical protein
MENKIENGYRIVETKILSFGELLIGVEFESSNEDEITKVKKMFAEMANLIKDEYNSNQKSPIKSLLFDHAIGEIVNAQMAIVKLITFK